jgi:hypothetical protein
MQNPLSWCRVHVWYPDCNRPDGLESIGIHVEQSGGRKLILRQPRNRLGLNVKKGVPGLYLLQQMLRVFYTPTEGALFWNTFLEEQVNVEQNKLLSTTLYKCPWIIWCHNNNNIIKVGLWDRIEGGGCVDFNGLKLHFNFGLLFYLILSFLVLKFICSKFGVRSVVTMRQDLF